MLLINTFFFLLANIEKEEDSYFITYKVDLTEYALTETSRRDQKFSQLSFPSLSDNQGVIYQNGYELPVVRLIISDTGEFNVLTLDKYTLKLPHSFPQTTKSQTLIKENFTIEDMGIIDGKRFKLITLIPITYNSKTNICNITKSFVITIKKPVISYEYWDHREMERLSYGASIPAPQIPGFLLILGPKYQNIEESLLKDFIDQKKLLGFKVYIFNVKENATAEGIQKELQLAILSAKIKYAVIIGNTKDVPSLKNDEGTEENDYYYASSYTAETRFSYLKFQIGRISVDSISQLNTILSRTMNYISGSFFNPEDVVNWPRFLTTIISGIKRESAVNYIQNQIEGLNNISYPTEGLAGDLFYDRLIPSSEYLVNLFNNGRTLIHYFGNTSNNAWDHPLFTTDHINKLSDTYYPFVIMNADNLGKLTEDSISKAWLQRNAIAVWSATSETSTTNDAILIKSFYSNYKKSLTIGQLRDEATKYLWIYYGGEDNTGRYDDKYIIYGDPSVYLHNDLLRVPTLENFSYSFARVSQVLNYSVKDQFGNPIAGANVALVNEETMTPIDLAVSDKDGHVSLDVRSVSPSSSPYFRLSIYGQNIILNTYAMELKGAINSKLGITSLPTTPFISGEKIPLAFEVVNNGQIRTGITSIKMSVTRGPADIEGIENIIDIDPNQSVVINNNFLNVQPEAKHGDVITVLLSWRIRGYLDYKYFTFTVSNGFPSIDAKLNPKDNSEIILSVSKEGGFDISDINLEVFASKCFDATKISTIITPFAYTLPINEQCEIGETAKLDILVTYKIEGYSRASEHHYSIDIGTSDELEAILASPLEIMDSSLAVIPLTISSHVIIKNLLLTLEIEHSYFKDLEISLETPDKQRLFLRYNEDSDLKKTTLTYNSNDIEPLRHLVGLSSEGTWNLIISDNSEGDVGRINTATLKITGLK